MARPSGRWIAEHPGQFPYREVGLLYTAYRLGIPATIHVTIGADIIHQHPAADFGAIGAASGLDFRIFAASVSELEGGVFLNFGSAVTGPEVFLKALTIARNLGHKIERFTTANFDLRPLPDVHAPIGSDQVDYYYRPRKNIVNRPVSLGGQGFHITGDHTVTIPNLYQRVIRMRVNETPPPAPPQIGEGRTDFFDSCGEIRRTGKRSLWDRWNLCPNSIRIAWKSCWRVRALRMAYWRCGPGRVLVRRHDPGPPFA